MNSQQIQNLLTQLYNQPPITLTPGDDYDNGYGTGWGDALDAIKTAIANNDATL